MRDTGIRIRPARPDDVSWMTPLAPRMHEFGPPPWREVGVMDDAVAVQWARELAAPTPGSAMLVAEDSSGAAVGFVWLKSEPDFFSEDLITGHVVDIVVAREGEGRGVGRALLAAAERWAEDAGYPWLTLHVFAGNERARRVYEKAGYEEEWTRMFKRVGKRAPSD
jgi:ribosomal protein S18 acetylase RimI-like enzyme